MIRIEKTYNKETTKREFSIHGLSVHQVVLLRTALYSVIHSKGKLSPFDFSELEKKDAEEIYAPFKEMAEQARKKVK